MKLTTDEIAKMLDLSCVQVKYTDSDLDKLIKAAIQYKCGQVTTFQSLIVKCKQELSDHPDIHVVGNVSFPSGSDDTALKVIQAKQLIEAGCNEVDMVMNINWFKSGFYDQVLQDIKDVKAVLGDVSLKVIIEVTALTDEEIVKASEICLEAGAAFVKTGTGWAGKTTLEHVKLIKSTVGDKALIKASGGVRNLTMLIEMYEAGARRFGVNLETALKILEESAAG
ncbi:MAG: deoxyribose-phosphate aldolase [Spirochaetales bacterium]|uniref:Deoxyribose-phosphate aldolase n=1 Tax=Candidatus Thalassospirochaeta sargassi TaxID=3119039 RepID=A0AAJ1MMQ0_9SPIO|nr:deoxyribose-phosphate aldolase [Spirochaetales bacterium]